jgi:glutamine amidotransferase
MGWNTLTDVKSKLFDASIDGQYAYFVHSYYVPKTEDTIAATGYIRPFASAMHRANFYAVQFHPEKSGATGERILLNFLNL